MVILDELTYLIHYGFLTEKAVLEKVTRRPGHQHLVITGRNASQGLVDAADLVTEMRAVKHPYQAGIKAQKGVEFLRLSLGQVPAVHFIAKSGR